MTLAHTQGFFHLLALGDVGSHTTGASQIAVVIEEGEFDRQIGMERAIITFAILFAFNGLSRMLHFQINGPVMGGNLRRMKIIVGFAEHLSWANLKQALKLWVGQRDPPFQILGKDKQWCVIQYPLQQGAALV
jgi:hypothetical protein